MKIKSKVGQKPPEEKVKGKGQPFEVAVKIGVSEKEAEKRAKGYGGKKSPGTWRK
jgi:hypothetical protein